MNEILLYCIMVAILIFGIVFFGKWLSLKRQLRYFVRDAEKLKADDYKKIIRVESFDKDIVATAHILNTYIQREKDISVLYKNKEQELHDVITGISHDFRTPLTAISGYLQMIDKSKRLDGKEEQYLKIVMQKTKHLHQLSDDFFEMCVIEGQQETVYEKINICTILTECLLGYYEQIEARGLQTAFDIPEEPILIAGDTHALNRIFENLVSNSIKYAQKRMSVLLRTVDGRITVRISNDVEQREQLDLESVFKPFYRGGSRKEEGSGVGLYVAKLLSEQMGLKIRAFFDEQGEFVIVVSG